MLQSAGSRRRLRRIDDVVDGDGTDSLLRLQGNRIGRLRRAELLCVYLDVLDMSRTVGRASLWLVCIAARLAIWRALGIRLCISSRILGDRSDAFSCFFSVCSFSSFRSVSISGTATLWSTTIGSGCDASGSDSAGAACL